MKQLAYFLGVFLFLSCQSPNPSVDEKTRAEFLLVADSASSLLHAYHYNPSALEEEEYLRVETDLKELAETCASREAFIQGFNAIWSDGPFSHVRLAHREQSAKDMADYIDQLKVGEQALALDWMDQTAILTINTMTGADTKERVIEALTEISEREAQNLIIDLRQNTGGTFAGIPLMNFVVDDSLDAGAFVSRKWWTKHSNAPQPSDYQNLEAWEGWSIKSFWQDVQEAALTRVQIKPGAVTFHGPVYVLTSRKTASAAEFTADALRRGDSVRLIGENTAGEMLSQKMFDLPMELQLSLPIADYYSSKTGRIEGKGVRPDIDVPAWAARDIALGIIAGFDLDSALIAVAAQAKERAKNPFEGETLYLFGSMNDWGKDWDNSPPLEFKGNGVFELDTHLPKGEYEFKIAPMNWDFDFGASKEAKALNLGEAFPLVKEAGSANLKLQLNEDSKIRIQLRLIEGEKYELWVDKI